MVNLCMTIWPKFELPDIPYRKWPAEGSCEDEICFYMKAYFINNPDTTQGQWTYWQIWEKFSGLGHCGLKPEGLRLPKIGLGTARGGMCTKGKARGASYHPAVGSPG